MASQVHGQCRRSSNASSASPVARSLPSCPLRPSVLSLPGVIGIACIQALIIGVLLMIAGVPFAGVLAVVVLVFGVAQLPALLVTLPVIAWIWVSGEYDTGPGGRLHGSAVRRWHGRQRAEAAHARPRRRCADAGHPDRRARRHGDHRHPRHVRRRNRCSRWATRSSCAGYTTTQSGCGNPPRAVRPPLREPMRDVSPARAEQGCAPWPARCSSEAAPRLGRISNAPRCRGWPAGRAARSIR